MSLGNKVEDGAKRRTAQTPNGADAKQRRRQTAQLG